MNNKKAGCGYISPPTGKAQPVFIEGTVFCTEVPIPSNLIGEELSEGLNEGLNEGLSDFTTRELTDSLILLLNAVSKHPGSKVRKLSTVLNNKPIKTIERQVGQLIKKGLIERIGSKKTGGYFLVKNLRDLNKITKKLGRLTIRA